MVVTPASILILTLIYKRSPIITASMGVVHDSLGLNNNIYLFGFPKIFGFLLNSGISYILKSFIFTN